jgi:hypothetical protein
MSIEKYKPPMYDALYGEVVAHEGSTGRFPFQPLGVEHAAGASSANLRPWAITINNTAGTADFKYCALVIGPCTLFNADIDGHSISGGSTDAWISVKYSTVSGEMTIISGGEYDDVTDQTPPADPEFVKRLLYKLKRSGVGKPWRVEVDYRSLGLGIYI